MDDFESQFKTDQAPAAEAAANLRNAVAAVFWVAMLVLLAVAPAVVIAVWRVLVNTHLDRYITERYVDAICRDTGATREQALDALRRALDLPAGGLPNAVVALPRRHSPGAVLLVITLLGAAWTATAAAVFALIWGWRP